MEGFTLNWLDAHPNVLHFIVWPLISAIITAVFKPRTPAEYEAMPPRISAFLKIVGSLGIDVPNLMDAARQLTAGKAKPAAAYTAERNTLPPPFPKAEKQLIIKDKDDHDL